MHQRGKSQQAAHTRRRKRTTLRRKTSLASQAHKPGLFAAACARHQPVAPLVPALERWPRSEQSFCCHPRLLAPVRAATQGQRARYARHSAGSLWEERLGKRQLLIVRVQPVNDPAADTARGRAHVYRHGRERANADCVGVTFKTDVTGCAGAADAWHADGNRLAPLRGSTSTLSTRKPSAHARKS